MNKILITLTFLSLFNGTFETKQNLPKFQVSSNYKTVIVGESCEILLDFNHHLSQSVTLNFTRDQPNLILWSPTTLSIPINSSNSNITIKIDALKAGSVEVTTTASPSDVIDVTNLFFRITIGNSKILIILSLIIGWIYFVCWTVNSYPQIWLNFQRKSVIGLSFDFVALNIIGHFVYSVFNGFLYFSKYFEDEYLRRFPHGQNPVELNDVFAAIHGFGEYALILFQCAIYERGDQRVSNTTWSICFSFLITLTAVAIFCWIGRLHWLDLLYACSYIKLAVTLVKYIPQAILNYNRKSTVGWSIANILLDFIGGLFSILQMFLNSYNYDDWQSNFGNPSKLLLGILTILFALIFIVQHYCLYSQSKHPMMDPQIDEKSKEQRKEEESEDL